MSVRMLPSSKLEQVLPSQACRSRTQLIQEKKPNTMKNETNTRLIRGKRAIPVSSASHNEKRI